RRPRRRFITDTALARRSASIVSGFSTRTVKGGSSAMSRSFLCLLGGSTRISQVVPSLRLEHQWRYGDAQTGGWVASESTQTHYPLKSPLLRNFTAPRP